MKKLLIILMVFVTMYNINVYAFAGTPVNQGNICSEDKTYAAIYIDTNKGPMYFLTPNTIEGYALEDYTYDPIDKDLTPYVDSLKYVAFAKLITEEYGAIHAIRYIWEHTHPNINYNYCGSEYLESVYSEVTDLIDNITNHLGLENHNYYYHSNEMYTEYNDDFMYYTFNNNDDTYLSTNVIVSNYKNNGVYENVLTLKPNGSTTIEMYTNGTNYLSYMPPYQEDYSIHLNFYIDYRKIEVNNVPDGTLYFIDNQNREYKLTEDLYLPDGTYTFKYESDNYKLLTKEVEITEDETFNLHFEQQGTISFVPDNTLEFGGILIVIMLILLYVFA